MIAPILEDKYAFINDLVSSSVSFYGPFLTFSSRSTSVFAQAPPAAGRLVLVLRVEAPVIATFSNNLDDELPEKVLGHFLNLSRRD